MSLLVEFLSGADIDLQNAFSWFEDSREGLGTEFMAAADDYLARLAIFPRLASIYLGGSRRQVMRKLPYGIFYEPQSARILVLAILDLRQDEEQIMRRLHC